MNFEVFLGDFSGYFGKFRDFFAERCTGFFQRNLPPRCAPLYQEFFAKDFASSDYPNENESFF